MTRAFGPAFESHLDASRLATQMDRIRAFMLTAGWQTVSEIREGLERLYPGTRFPENSIQAQLRHLRKPAFGGYQVVKRRRGSGSTGLFEYRLLSPEQPVPARNPYQEETARLEQTAMPLFSGGRPCVGSA